MIDTLEDLPQEAFTAQGSAAYAIMLSRRGRLTAGGIALISAPVPVHGKMDAPDAWETAVSFADQVIVITGTAAGSVGAPTGSAPARPRSRAAVLAATPLPNALRGGDAQRQYTDPRSHSMGRAHRLDLSELITVR